MNKLSIGIMLLFSLVLHSQGEYNNWMFGIKAGMSFNGTNVSGISSQVICNESSASISDKNGNLLFYAGLSSVWNKNHTIMENGDEIATDGGSGDIQQAFLIVPKPENSSIYYLFSIGDSDFSKGGVNPWEYKLYYHIIDINQNNGLGKVISKNNLLVINASEKLTATRHSNGKDFYIINRNMVDGVFNSFLLDKNGLKTTPIISKIGKSIESGDLTGSIKVSNSGCWLASVIRGGWGNTPYLELFKFNNSTGLVSEGQSKTFNSPYGIEFSPNSQYLYLGSNGNEYIKQFDLSSGDINLILNSPINASSTQLNTFEFQLGPDNKIYVQSSFNSYLATISQPNNNGLNCQFLEKQVYIPSISLGSGFPNNFNLIYSGNLNVCNSVFCDTTLLSFNFKDSILNYGDSLIIKTQKSIKWNIAPSHSFYFNKDSTMITFKPNTQTKYSIEVSDSCLNKRNFSFSLNVFKDTVLKDSNVNSCTIWIPNSFSPNFDNVNDNLKIYTNGNCYKTIDFKIYNRWGEKIFQTNDINQHWDGIYKNIIQPTGVYIYTLEISRENKIELLKGQLNLFH